MDLLCAQWVDPVRQSPRTQMYGCFAHGTVPPLRLYSLTSFLFPSALACRLPRPTSVADRSVTRLSPRLRYYSAVRLLARHRFPLRLSTYRVAYPDATRGPCKPSWGHP